MSTLKKCKYTDYMEEVRACFQENDPDAYAVLTYTDTFEVLNYAKFLLAEIEEEKLLDVRVFNRNHEYRIFRDYCGNGDYQITRLPDDLIDKHSNTRIFDFDTYDDYQFLDIDVKRTEAGGSTHPGRVRATGGGWYKLPFEKDQLNDLKAVIQNYVAYDENGQASLIAWRLAGFCNNKKDESNGSKL